MLDFPQHPLDVLVVALDALPDCEYLIENRRCPAHTRRQSSIRSIERVVIVVMTYNDWARAISPEPLLPVRLVHRRHLIAIVSYQG